MALDTALAGLLQLDGGERHHERPAQAKPVLHGLVEILRRDVTLADQAKRFGQQCALEPIEHEPFDLATHHDRHLLDRFIHLSGARNGFRRGPGRADQFDDRHRSEEHTSELQSRSDLVCRLLLEKKKKDTNHHINIHRHTYQRETLAHMFRSASVIKDNYTYSSNVPQGSSPRASRHMTYARDALS